jgi:hypothetical protein
MLYFHVLSLYLSSKLHMLRNIIFLPFYSRKMYVFDSEPKSTLESARQRSEDMCLKEILARNLLSHELMKVDVVVLIWHFHFILVVGSCAHF